MLSRNVKLRLTKGGHIIRVFPIVKRRLLNAINITKY